MFHGLKGESRFRFNDPDKIPFDLVAKASEGDLIRVIAHLADDHHSILPLQQDLFTEQEHLISYTSGTTIRAPIGRQFDALITYPEVIVLKSMDQYDWR